MSLIESIAALAIESIVMIGLVATLGTSTSMTAELREQRDRIVDLRRVEQLLDHTFALATASPQSSASVALTEPTRLLLLSDLDRNGSIDPRSSEHTEFYLREDEGGPSLVQRLGRQSITLLRGLPPGARMKYRDGSGRPTNETAAVRLLGLPLGEVEYLIALRVPES